MSEAKLGTFEELLHMTEEPLRPLMRALRATIYAIHPDACEVVRLGDRAATYGVGPRKMLDGYAYLLPHKRWVNLGFYAGAELPDPEGLLEGTGAKMRHMKVRTLQDVERPGLRTLIQQALESKKGAMPP